MDYRKQKSIMFLLLLVVGTIISSSDNQYTSANPISSIDLPHGVLLPTNVSHGVIMERADVLFNIDADRYTHHALFEYMGNYTFYNTNDTQQELLVGAPFTYGLPVEKVSVFVNDIETNFVHYIKNFISYHPILIKSTLGVQKNA